MLVAGAVCPHPPLLVPAVAAGAAHELDPLRAACDEAVKTLLAAEPDVVSVVGAAPHSGILEGTGGTLAPYGVPVEVGRGEPSLPLALTIGCWLLDRAGWSGARRFLGVQADASAGDAQLAAAEAVAVGERVAILAMGDGSARRTEKAPGYLDDRAPAYDESIAAALASGPHEVAALDGALASELLVAGWPSWQVLAAAASLQPWSAKVLYNEAPYGVGYFVATWSVD